MLRIVTPAAADPVTLAEAKAQLRITDTSQDDMITALVSAATISAQSVVQRLFVTQTVEWVLEKWPACIDIPVAPVAFDTGIVSVKYIDWTTQTQKTLDPSLYVVKTIGPSVSIIPKFATIWPIVFPYSSEPIVVRFIAGSDVGDVPTNVKQAILLMVRHLYSLGERSPFIKRDRVEGIGEKYFQIDPGAVDLIPDAAQALLRDEVW